MAFAARSFRILCKVYNGNSNATYSTLRKPFTKINFSQAAQKCQYSTESKSPKITGSLTNIQASLSTPVPSQTLSEKINQNQENTSQEDEEEKKKREHSWKMMKYSFIAFGASIGIAGSMFIYELSQPTYDENGNIQEDEYSHLPFVQRVWFRFFRAINYYKKLVQEPSREKLLPDPVKYPYIQPPYTLVLELTDVLVHPDWTYKTGWRFKKRPGVTQFLEAVAPPNFEVVIYTAEQGMTVKFILDSLDPNDHVSYILPRDTTRFVDGHHVKDLDALNRDLKRVIVIDWNPNSVKLHPENTLILPRWTGNDNDTTLYDLAVFLKTILTSNLDDVRDALAYYKQFDNPMEAFRENQRKLLLQIQEDEIHKAQRESSKNLISKWSPSFLRSH
ncbi:mitochondrial import inner membrane translocase subunit TIM50-C-like [Chelonus insularis]|uniref:mitochondrial import inner membrane translocase subunit TIM50-C-like n=1 Tax=Chelonus insularis TaxID=460826 RepID=UPI00158C8F48|nr:mitochondrial import inner membrane translocase subunit TIM50-C-like [Chelonus insularis]